MSPINSMQYKRILLKLSGEALMAKEGGIDHRILLEIANQVKEIRELGIEIGIVLGGGNIFRGKEGEKDGIDRVTGDYIGMLATVINALAFQDTLETLGVPARLQTALSIEKMAEPYDRKMAIEHLQNRKIVIFACGTGNPYFTTDTAAALRAIEMKADVLMKATKVNGIYDKDPETSKDAKFFPEITFTDILNRDLQVMDLTAITLCKENNLPIIVLNIREKDNLKRAVLGEHIGTIVRRKA
ncbi:MAG: UMP kinase [Syntrophorhabdaceae bacterium]|nr:UMP kinase [Syntrophorhabdaceae bacterium]MDD5244064.1 UMP kinase [Syntrophorhabdaceae bacterium]